MSVNYEEQVVIISIKLGIQCFMYQVLPKERENLYKIWALKIYKSTRAQIALEEIEEWIEDHDHRDPNCVYSMKNFV